MEKFQCRKSEPVNLTCIDRTPVYFEHKIWSQGGKIWSQGGKIWTQGGKIWSQGGNIWSQGGKIWTQGVLSSKLCLIA